MSLVHCNHSPTCALRVGLIQALALMTSRPAVQLPARLYVRLLALVISCVISGIGLLSLIIGHLEAAPAHAFGLSMFFFGLLPLALAMRTPKSAVWLAGTSVVLGLSALVVGPTLLG